MSLPKLQVHVRKLKSLDSTVSYTIKPFTVKEQKILLVAKESIKAEPDSKKSMSILFDALEQVLGNCLVGNDINNVPWYDFTFLMLELRKMSVDNISSLAYRCTSTKNDGEVCGNQFSVNVDLDKLQTKGVLHTSKEDRIIKIDEHVSVFMRHPTFGAFKKIYSEDIDDIQALRLFIEYVYDDEGNIYPLADTSNEELEEFIIDMGPKAKLLQDWIKDCPKPYFSMEYTCKGCGSKKRIELKDINDFF